MPKVERCKIFLHIGPLSWILPHTSKQGFPMTAFISPFGKYKYLKVPFALAQAPQYFQNLINKVKHLLFAIAYLDDIIIYSKTTDDHLDHLKQIFHKL